MDSKSIPRKGVGVRLPSLAPASDASSRARRELAELARELAHELFPTLRRKLRAATQELERGERFLRGPRRAQATSAAACSWLEATQDTVERLGWCLGALSAAQDVDVLFVRHEPCGLRWLMALQAESSGRTVQPGIEALPLLSPSRRAWELPVLATWLASVTRGARTRWSFQEADGASWLVLEHELEEAELGALSARCRALGAGDLFSLCCEPRHIRVCLTTAVDR